MIKAGFKNGQTVAFNGAPGRNIQRRVFAALGSGIPLEVIIDKRVDRPMQYKQPDVAEEVLANFCKKGRQLLQRFVWTRKLSRQYGREIKKESLKAGDRGVELIMAARTAANKHGLDMDNILGK